MANQAAGSSMNNMSPLQLHVTFFDRNNDGIVYPWETYAGMRALGFERTRAFFTAIAINVALSYSTLESWIPSLVFPIYIKNIHRSKHGSDSGVYDQDGQFNETKFEGIFSEFARTKQDKLSLDEIVAMMRHNQDAGDFFGRSAAKLEWGAAFMLVKDSEGYASKESIRGIYDGSIFYQIAKQREEEASKS